MKRLLSFIVLLLPGLVLAQSITIEALHPQFKFAGAKPTALTSAWFVTLSLPISNHISFVGQVPFAFGKLKNSRVPTKDETIGNPAVGLRLAYEHFSLDVAARIPIVENGFAGFVGSVADIDRQEAFVPDIVALTGMIKTKIGGGPFTIHPYGGVSFNVKTDHERNDFFARIFKLREDDGEMFLLYGGEGWLQIRKFHLGGTFNGRAWLSSGAGFAKSTIHQVNLRAKLVFQDIAFGALFRFPLDDILLDNVIGVQLEVNP